MPYFQVSRLTTRIESAPGRAQPGVGGGVADRRPSASPDPAACVDVVGAVNLADADEHGGAGIERHGRTTVSNVTCRRLGEVGRQRAGACRQCRSSPLGRRSYTRPDDTHRHRLRPRRLRAEAAPRRRAATGRATTCSTSAPTPPRASTTRRSAPRSAGRCATARPRSASCSAAAARASSWPPTRSTACAPRCATTCTRPGMARAHNDANVLSHRGAGRRHRARRGDRRHVPRHPVRGRPPRPPRRRSELMTDRADRGLHGEEPSTERMPFPIRHRPRHRACSA